jgi:hypothetical protein
MFNFADVKRIVINGGSVEYRGNSICDLKQVLRYPFHTNTPYQVNLKKAKFNKKTGDYEGDTLYNNVNEAVNDFLEECRKA